METCSFCQKPMAFGTGKLYVKKDGKIFYFCSNKCEKNLLELKRKPAKLKWASSVARAKKKEREEKLKEIEKTENKVK